MPPCLPDGPFIPTPTHPARLGPHNEHVGTARAIWKGVIRFGSFELPVKLYSAVEDRTVHFNLLHDQSMTRVKQRMVNPHTNKEVERDQVRKGVQVEPGRFVVLSDEELEKLTPEPSRDITIERFIENETLTDPWYDRPYYLGPDDDANEKDYWALVEALERHNLEGVAHWTMRNKEYLGSLTVHQGYLMLITLRHAEEIIDADHFDAPTGRKLDAKELKLSEQLVGALEDKFDPTEYRDEYRHRVLDLIQRKAKGQKIEIKKPAAKKAAGDELTAALEASIKAVGKSKKEAAYS